MINYRAALGLPRIHNSRSFHKYILANHEVTTKIHLTSKLHFPE